MRSYQHDCPCALICVVDLVCHCDHSTTSCINAAGLLEDASMLLGLAIFVGVFGEPPAQHMLKTGLTEYGGLDNRIWLGLSVSEVQFAPKLAVWPYIHAK